LYANIDDCIRPRLDVPAAGEATANVHWSTGESPPPQRDVTVTSSQHKTRYRQRAVRSHDSVIKRGKTTTTTDQRTTPSQTGDGGGRIDLQQQQQRHKPPVAARPTKNIAESVSVSAGLAQRRQANPLHTLHVAARSQEPPTQTGLSINQSSLFSGN